MEAVYTYRKARRRRQKDHVETDPTLQLFTNNLEEDPNKLFKWAIWAYFFLLIFEGALRKWFLPGLATPLLVIRDPLALWLVFMVWKKGLLKINIYFAGMALIGIIGIYTAIFAGHGNLMVAIFGARIMLLHFPLIFVMGSICDRDDVLKIGKIVLWLTLPMTILLALQFYSPQDAWVNRGIGGDMAGAGFDGALGYYRPSGTFSFTTGTTLFYSMATCFIFYYWFTSQNINRILLLSATVALLIAIPLSISRALLFQVAVSFIFVILATGRNPKFIGKILVIGLVGIVAVIALTQINFFNTATEAFSSRFESASGHEGGLQGTLVDRFLGGLIGSLTETSDLPLLGYGLGMGTNAGSSLLTGGRSFLIAEEEWGRLIGELGMILGLTVIFLRIGLVIKMTLVSYRRLVKGDLLPWLLLSFGSLVVLQGQWAQPTSLGFAIIMGGFILASFKPSSDLNIKHT